MRFVFGLIIFLPLFAAGAGGPLPAHAAGGFGGIEIAADFDFSRAAASVDGAISEGRRRVGDFLTAADGIFAGICQKIAAGAAAGADFCAAAGEALTTVTLVPSSARGQAIGRQTDAGVQKITVAARSFSVAATATAGRAADGLKSGISETKNDLFQGAAAVKNEIFPEVRRLAAGAAVAAVNFPASLGKVSEQKIVHLVKNFSAAGEAAIKNAFAGIAIVHDMGQGASRIAADGIFAVSNAGQSAARIAADGIFAANNAGQSAGRAVADGIFAAGGGFCFVADTAAGAGASAVYNLGNAFGQTLGLAGDVLELARGDVAHGLRRADYDLKVAARAGQANATAFFDGVKNNVRDRLRRWLGIEDSPDNDQLSINDQIPNDQFSEGLTLSEDQRVRPSENQPASIVQNIYPEREVQTKEIQTIHTKEVQTKTETIVVDGGTKDRVEHISRQMDSDRPNYSLGQSFSLPSSLVGRRLGIGNDSDYDNFTVDEDGNVNAQTLVAAGDVTVQGNFSVTGAQTFSGAAALNASTTVPLFAIDQSGDGAALRADNILLKGSKIDFSGLGSLEIDGDGYLILASQNGKIKAADGNVFYTAGGHPINAPGEEILRASTPIFGFDIPARTAAGDFVPVSKEMVLSGDSFPAPMEGTARVYKLNIVYSDDAAASPSSWRIYNITAGAAGEEFAVPAAQTGGLAESATHITAALALPAAGEKWRVDVKSPAGKTIQIYRISLEAYDRIE